MNNITVKTPSLSEFCNAATRLVRLRASLEGVQIDSDLETRIKLWSTGLFRLVVMGEVKKGKSSFINALLGRKDLVPVSDNVATSIIYKICYGEELAYKVFFTKASNKSAITIRQDEVGLYGTEDGNPENRKDVDFIQVFVPSEILKDGLVIIDTPGLGGLFRQHKRITYEYVPKADAVFLVSDSVESPIGKAELELLSDLRRVTDKIYFVQTKAMVVDEEACESRKNNNCRILTSQGGIPADKLSYFVIDSHLKFEADASGIEEELEASGFKELVGFINDNIKGVAHRHIMLNALAMLRPVYEYVGEWISHTEKIHNAKSEEEKKAVTARLMSAKQEVERWKERIQEIKDSFNRGLMSIKDEAMNMIKSCSDRGGLYQNYLDEINMALTAEELERIQQRINENLPSAATECMYSAIKYAQQEMENLISDIQRSGLEEMNGRVNVGNGADGISTQPITGGKERTSLLTRIRAPFLGSSIGGAIGVQVGAIVGSIVSVIGTAVGSVIGSVVGSLWGLFAGNKERKTNELKQYRQQLEMRLSRMVSGIYREMTETISRILRDAEYEQGKALKAGISARERMLNAQLEECRSMQTASFKTAEEKRARLMAFKMDFVGIEKVMKSV